MIDDQDPALSPEGAQDETVTDPQVKEENAESSEQSGEGAGAGSPQDDQKSEELEVHVDGEEPPPAELNDNHAWARIRKSESEARARVAQLERELQAKNQPQVVDPGPKPTLESCDFDEARKDRELIAWHEATKLKESAQNQAAQEAQQANHETALKRLAYGQARESLIKKMPAYEELEKIVGTTLKDHHVAIILNYADNPTVVIAALGRDPKRLQDFAQTKDLGSLIAKVAKLEVKTVLKPKNNAPPPEKPLTGNGSKSGGGDKTLERLRAEADKDPTGNRSAVTEYLRKKREASRGK